jgi:hypothetical protein
LSPGLADLFGADSSIDTGSVLFRLQKVPLTLRPKLIPRVEGMLIAPGESGRNVWPGEASEACERCDARLKEKRFRRPPGRRGEFEWGVLGEPGKGSPAYAEAVYEVEPGL